MVCVDTSFLIDVLSGHDEARALMEELDARAVRPTVTPVTAAELWVGAALGSTAEYEDTAELLESLVWLDFSRSAARLAGQIQAALKDSGNPIAFSDCMIAAVAIDHDEQLVTRDSDFERIPDLRLRTY